MTDPKRQFIAVTFEIDLPLRADDLKEAIGLLEGLLGILRSAQERRREQERGDV